MVEDFLEARGSRHFIAAPGTTPDASLVGNLMERGWGFGPHSARFEHMCAFEVVLADGTVIDTGNARFPGSRSADLFRWGVGPWVDGLFTQSNLGVVTRMTMFLALLPDQWASFVYKVDSEAQLPALLDVLRELRMKQILRTNFKLQNFYRVLQAAERWPEGVTGPELPAALVAEKKAQYGMGDWNGFGALYCYSDAQYRAEREIVDTALRPYVDTLLWLDRDVLERRDELRDSVRAETGFDLDKALDHYFINTRLVGIDKGHGLKGAYFHKSGYSDHPDLDVDRVGVLWVDPIVPFRGTDIRNVIDIAEEVMHRHGFEKNLGFNVVTERSMFTTCLLLWDRDVTGDDERGMACAVELVDRFMAAGYTLGRLAHPFVATVMNQGSPESRRFLRTLKEALDPQGIIAPGRYEAETL
jgi:4-cresol dehydrogenase (hydroxylating)